ncbi:hypothetical protein RZS08_15930, partial [Arthrospira platensis SPKY1]|nr:hypothetical protein [Arthrospira platensis SPKY1]
MMQTAVSSLPQSKHRRHPLLRFIACLALAGAAWLASTARPANSTGENANLADLLPGQDYVTWYQTHTGYAPNAAFFGAYSLKPDDDTLYLGYGTSWPAAEDGALLASYDACAGLQGLAALNEQGFLDLRIANGKVYIPG